MGISTAPGAMTGDEIVELTKRHTIFEWSAQAKVDPIPVAGAKGCWFWTPEGKRYLDFNSQLMCTNIGHGDERVVKAIAEQAATLAYANPFMATEPRARLGAKLAELTPGDIDTFFFTNGGAEANENAIKVARMYSGRHKIAVRYRAYHGGTAGAITLTGDPRRWAAEPGIPGVIRIPDFHRWGQKDPDPVGEVLQATEDVLMYEGPKTVAAIIVETVVGTNGILIPPDGYMQGLREICDRHGILLVADEVMAGFGRTGKWFAIDHWGVEPDLITMAKGLTSAYVQLGALGMRHDIAAHFRDNVFYGGLTYNSHPLACATALAAIDVIEEDGLVERAAQQGLLLRQLMDEMTAKHPSVGSARNIGLFGIFDLVRNRDDLRADGGLQRHERRDGGARQALPERRPVHVRALEQLLHEPAPHRHRRGAAARVRHHRPRPGDHRPGGAELAHGDERPGARRPARNAGGLRSSVTLDQGRMSRRRRIGLFVVFGVGDAVRCGRPSSGWAACRGATRTSSALGVDFFHDPPFRLALRDRPEPAPLVGHRRRARGPGPTQPGVSLLQFLLGASFYTWREAALGFLVGTLLGLLLATLFVHFGLLERAFVPYVVASQTIPIVALAPMIVFAFGPSVTSVVVIATYLTFFPVTIAMIRGLRSPDPRALELMRSYAASKWQIYRHVRLPASMPYLFTALKIAATASIVGAIIGEGPGGIPDGLGRAIINFNQQYITGPEKLWAAILVSSLLGIAFFLIIRVAERYALRNRPTGGPGMTDQPGAAVVRISGVDKLFGAEGGGDHDRPAGHQPRHPARGVPVADRPLGLRQVDPVAHHRGPHPANDRHGDGQRQAVRPCAPRSRLRDGLPGTGAVRLADRRGQRQAAARADGLGQGSSRRAGAGDARARRARRLHAPLPLPAVGRHAAARGDRAGPLVPAVDPADGRAVRRARRDDARADEPGGAAHLGAHRDHRGVRDALDPRGRLPQLTRGRDERRGPGGSPT